MKRFSKSYVAVGAALVWAALVAPAFAQTDTTAPAVSGILPITAQAGASTQFSATYSDAVGVTSCDLWVDGTNQGSMSLSGSLSGTATKSFTLQTFGSHTLQARCGDAMGNIGIGTSTSVATGDTIAPTVGGISPIAAIAGQSTQFSASYSDAVGISSCDLWVNGTNQGSMSVGGTSSGTATKSFTLQTAGSYTLQARCRDTSGNERTGESTTVTAVVSGGADVTAPAVGGITPMTVQTGVATGVSASYSDSVGVTACDLYVDDINRGAMSIGSFSSGLASATYTFGSNGAHGVYVRCRDAAGNFGTSSTATITAQAIISPAPQLPPFSISQMDADATLTLAGSRQGHLDQLQMSSCEWTDANARARAIATVGTVSNQAVLQSVINFAACGTISTLHLGAGERLGAVNSFLAAYGHLPQNHDEWLDVAKIANGRFPGAISATAEANAKVRFRQIYLREPNMSAAFDANAVVVMAYGLRPLPRNLNSEAQAQVFFRGIFGHTATSATDWDAVRAIAYSGATR